MRALMSFVRPLLLLSLLSLPAVARPTVRLALEGHGSLFNSGSGAALLGLNFGGGLRGGVDLNEHWGVFLHVENDVWGNTGLGGLLHAGVLNYGVGGEFRFAGGLMRTSLTLGASTLLEPTVIDPAGSTGIFVEFRPPGLRWTLARAAGATFVLGLDPISFMLEMPVLSGIPLARIQYRTSLCLEVAF